MQTIYWDNIPTPVALVRADLKQRGLADHWIEKAVSTAVPFYNKEHSTEDGRFISGDGGGGGGGSDDKGGKSGGEDKGAKADDSGGKFPGMLDPKSPEATRLLKLHAEATEKVKKSIDDENKANRPLVLKAIAAAGSGIAAGAKAIASLKTVKRAAELVTDAMRAGADVMGHANPMNPVSWFQGGTALARQWSGRPPFGNEDSWTKNPMGLGDKHYDSMVKEYGKTTANLIACSGHLATASLAVLPVAAVLVAGIASGGGITVPALAGAAKLCFGKAAAGAGLAGAHALGVGAIGQMAARYTNYGRMLTRMPAMYLVSKVTGKKIVRNSGEEDFEIDPDILAMFEEANFAAKKSVNKDDIVTLPDAKIKSLGIKLVDAATTDYLRGLVYHSDFLNNLAGKMVKDGIPREKLEELGKKDTKAEMSVWLDGKETPWYTAFDKLKATGLTEDEAYFYTFTLEQVA